MTFVPAKYFNLVKTYKIELKGWPSGLHFGSPFNIGKKEDLKTLRSALRDSTLRWVKVKRERIDEIVTKNILPGPLPPSKSQKKRAANKENVGDKAPPAKRPRGQKKSMSSNPKSVEIIEDSSDEEGSASTQ